LEFAKILIFITVDIFKHTAKKNKKIKRADQTLPEVYDTTLSGSESVQASYRLFLYVLLLGIQLSRGENWDRINMFNPTTCLWLSQTRT
jgi:hypothetical protein